MSSPSPDEREWLETDGLGGFAMGTVSGIRTRRYHGLLLTATTPPSGRMMLVNGFEAWVETPGGRFAFSSQRYVPGVVYPDGYGRIAGFESEPWPSWRFVLPDGTRIEQELFIARGAPIVALAWRLSAGRALVRLAVRPLFSGRDFHALHRENGALNFAASVAGEHVTWRPYAGVPAIVSLANGAYTHEPEWYRRFLYTAERARGLDDCEDLASPGVLRWDLAAGDAVWLLAPEGQGPAVEEGAAATFRALRAAESRRRGRLSLPLERAADAYLVRRGAGASIIAGYPWFGDWGRDTFIALRGLCLATGRLACAREVFLTWAGAVSEGMLPNRFPDRGETPEYNSVDASLWFVIAVAEFLGNADEASKKLSRRDRAALLASVEGILTGYTQGTRFGIRVDDDGLLAAGEPGAQLTWMDARVDGRVVTPRVGKPVEVQALWLNAIKIGVGLSGGREELFERGLSSFRDRFWNGDRGCLLDVVDVDHVAGRVDATVRPNQILAVGGLPVCLLESEQARRVVAAVEESLLTPIGLRSLAPDEPGYAPRYEGGVGERDVAYHQGTVWPWLLGPFAEAWVRVRGNTAAARRQARRRFLAPLLGHLRWAGLGHLPEIADAEAPHAPRGCPFQAWSVGEALRLDRVVLADPGSGPRDPEGQVRTGSTRTRRGRETKTGFARAAARERGTP